jgi:PPP family 3-phenylpropionic acid transporter
MNRRSMAVERRTVLQFMALYAVLFSAFGCASPFLPAFLAGRGLGPEELGLVLGAATALRLVCGPVAGRLADRLQTFRAELAVCAILAASAALLYLVSHGFWAVLAISLFQAAALAPLVPLADALSLAHARPQRTVAGFDYGWVRGVGSAAFVAGTLLAGHATGRYGLPAIMWLSATALLAIPLAAKFVPRFLKRTDGGTRHHEGPDHPWLILLRQRAFRRVTLVAALVLGSHAMYDSFAVVRWSEADISPASIGLLWSESVAAEVLVFLLIGTTLLRLLKPTGALALAAVCGVLRWGVMAQTTEVAALAFVQPLHGFTFALLHLASMRLITDTVPSVLAGTAQAVYGVVGVGGATAVLIIVSGWLYSRFGSAGFWAMALLCIAAVPVVWSLHRTLSRLSPAAQHHDEHTKVRPSFPVCLALLVFIIVMQPAWVSAQAPSNTLQPPSAFASIADPAERSRALFTEAAAVRRRISPVPAGVLSFWRSRPERRRYLALLPRGSRRVLADGYATAKLRPTRC